MTDRDLIRALYGLARRHPCANHQETALIRAAARRLEQLTEGGDGDDGERKPAGAAARPARAAGGA